MKVFLIVSISLLYLALVIRGQDPQQSGEAEATTITYTEAEILIYLTPQAQRIRAQGYDVGWDRSISAQLNQSDYFFFYLFDSKRKSYGSVTAGNYAVNKHTGDIWDQTEEKPLTSPELSGVQKILREEHHITARTDTEYRLRPLYANAEASPK